MISLDFTAWSHPVVGLWQRVDLLPVSYAIHPNFLSAATVAIRYATVRRQGNKSHGLEQQTITYPSTHHRVLPILSRAYVFIQLGRNLVRTFFM
jgi:hypothetical protein